MLAGKQTMGWKKRNKQTQTTNKQNSSSILSINSLSKKFTKHIQHMQACTKNYTGWLLSHIFSTSHDCSQLNQSTEPTHSLPSSVWPWHCQYSNEMVDGACCLLSCYHWCDQRWGKTIKDKSSQQLACQFTPSDWTVFYMILVLLRCNMCMHVAASL